MGLGGGGGVVVYLLSIGTHTRLQQQGIASDLLRLVEGRAREGGALALYLHVAAYNTAAVAFYTRHKFRRVALLKSFYSITTERQPKPGVSRYDALLYVIMLAGEDKVAAASWSHTLAQLRGLTTCLPWTPRRKNGLYLGNASRFEAVPTRTVVPDSARAAPSLLQRLFQRKAE
mmetsp:Transcript_10432/g.31415  ORF Transcript_10432/g.31415 Transcript_10432/m.31415 type:complete len:174 (+) Transcript_10432:2-523(+)